MRPAASAPALEPSRLTCDVSPTEPVQVGGLVLRPVVPDDGPAVHALLRATLPGVCPDRDRWLARWRWACWENPFRAGRPAGWVLANGAVMGHLGAVYLPLYVGGRWRLGQIGTDYAVAPEAAVTGGAFAGLALAQTFFRAAGEALPLATTANEKTAAVFGRFGCKPVDWTREFWRVPLTRDAYLRARWGGTCRFWRRMLAGRLSGRAARFLLRQLDRLEICPEESSAAGLRLEITMPRQGGALGEPRKPRVFAVARTAEYFDWRYACHPEHEAHRLICLSDAGDRLLAGLYLFVDSAVRPYTAYVEDAFSLEHSEEQLRVLLLAAQREAASLGAEFLVSAVGARWCRPIFWELGWQQRARNAPALVIPDIDAMNPSHESAGTSIELWHGAMF